MKESETAIVPVERTIMDTNFCTTCGRPCDEASDWCSLCLQKWGDSIELSPEEFCSFCGRHLDENGFCPGPDCT
jgi:predicted amidophosphoribosyltransferase